MGLKQGCDIFEFHRLTDELLLCRLSYVVSVRMCEKMDEQESRKGGKGRGWMNMKVKS